MEITAIKGRRGERETEFYLLLAAPGYKYLTTSGAEMYFYN